MPRSYRSCSIPIVAISLLFATSCTISKTMAFAPLPIHSNSLSRLDITPNTPHHQNYHKNHHKSHHKNYHHNYQCSALSMSNNLNNNNNNFDLSKPTFDLFAFRSIRNDALLQYNTLNQSEPLRINLYLFLTLTLFSLPTINESIGIVGFLYLFMFIFMLTCLKSL